MVKKGSAKRSPRLPIALFGLVVIVRPALCPIGSVNHATDMVYSIKECPETRSYSLGLLRNRLSNRWGRLSQLAEGVPACLNHSAVVKVPLPASAAAQAVVM